MIGAGTLLLGTACATQPVVNLRIGGNGSPERPCFVEANGERIAVEDIAANTGRWRRREVHMTFAPDTPYRCVGGVIFELQRAGLERVGFISEPPPAE
jgi:hypothetical protein